MDKGAQEAQGFVFLDFFMMRHVPLDQFLGHKQQNLPLSRALTPRRVAHRQFCLVIPVAGALPRHRGCLVNYPRFTVSFYTQDTAHYSYFVFQDTCIQG